MRRESTEVKAQGERSRGRLGARGSSAKRSRLRRLALEPLEERALMATGPLPMVSNSTGITTSPGLKSDGTRDAIDDSSPWVAIDPINPLKMITAYTHRNAVNGLSFTARASYSDDGGLSWSDLSLPANFFDATKTDGSRYQSQAMGVGFDRNENFYIGVLEVTTLGGTSTAGTVDVNIGNFSGSTPTNATRSVAYAWNQGAQNAGKQPGIANFQLAVDSNLSIYTDASPTTGQPVSQVDATAGNVYIAWTRNTPPPDNPPANFNPYTIDLVASADGINWGGNNGALVYNTTIPGTNLDDSNGVTSARNSSPRLAIAQGKVGGTDGGDVTVVWNDFGNNLIVARTVDVVGTTISKGARSSVTVASTNIRGNLAGTGTLASNASPIGIGPGPAIAIDNTLGAYSLRQGRIYVTYVDRYNTTGNEPDNSDIFLKASDDGGATWNAINTRQVNLDSGPHDGHTGGLIPSDSTSGHDSGRSQFQPAIAVDNSTGTVVLGWEDARDDAARARTAFYLTTSIDGGVTFSPQAFANAPQIVTDGIKQQQFVVGPLPDYNSVETSTSMGTHQAIAVANGVIHPVWSGTEQAGISRTRLTIRTAQATIPAGPRIISSTMGPVASTTINGFTFNNGVNSDNSPFLDGFAVTFDRPVDVQQFNPSDVEVRFRDTTTPLSAAGTKIDVLAVIPLNRVFNGKEATTFHVAFAQRQTAVGTYSYTIGPDVRDRMRGPNSDGNPMDQDADGRAGQTNDFYSAPKPTSAVVTPFAGPYDATTLPLIIPGPHIVSTFVPFVAKTADNLVLNNSNGYLTVVFDRYIDVSTFTPDQILGMTGPNGAIPRAFTVTPELSATVGPTFPQAGEDATHTRSFRIGFPFQSISGTYTVQLGAGIKSTNGDFVDANQNAGIDLLFTNSTSASVVTPITYSSPASPTAPVLIGAKTSASTTFKVDDNFLIKSLVVTLDITYPNDPDLVIILTVPILDPLTNKPKEYRLASNVGNVVGSHANFSNTIFDPKAKTPIQSGAAPFSGRFTPQDDFSDLVSFNNNSGAQVHGDYTLTIKNSGTGTGTLNRFSITVGNQTSTGTGLGEAVADRSSASFRIFTMDPTNPLSSSTWTAVGPASNNGNGNSSRIGAIALDPSDPSGNTAFVAGASGGVWKTYNFLTTDPIGPTYTPMTDFGPTLGINIGSIAVFGRNNDPGQSFVVAATGEGDINGRGAGFLISQDGGLTWDLFDSTDNTKPLANRDHAFVGVTSFKVLVDPRPSPTGDVIIYAAMGGRDGQNNARGGVWRSVDSGRHWTRMRAGNSTTGDATDLVFDPNSGVFDAFTNPTGNIRNLYAGFLGDGVYLTPNQGGVWNLLAGGVGTPLVQDFYDADSAAIGVANPPDTPNGAKGRIVLAKPALTGNPNMDIQYQTWLYAAVEVGSQLNGLYLTKDNGQNWTKVRIPTRSFGVADGFPTEVDPSNDISLPDYNILRGQGNYNLALEIDPNNPNVVYLGGTRDFQPTTLIRVDTARLSDPHSLYAGVGTLGNTTYNTGNDPVTIKDPANLVSNTVVAFDPVLQQFVVKTLPDPLFNPYTNLLRDPDNPFLANSTIFVTNTRNNTAGTGFSNSGSGAWWTPFVDFLNNQTDIHRIVTLKDPVTGKTRLIVGLDQGVFTGIDNGDGTLLRQIGNQGSPSSLAGTAVPTTGTLALPTGPRNGNLQINQFYNGAAQPSALAANVARALFYGMAQDNGFPASDPNILNNGNLQWTGSTGDGQDVATDQTGSGAEYSYRWPCCGGGGTNFFQVSPTVDNPIGRTFGLIQKSLPGKVPDPQWPFTGGFNFAVNPVSGDQIILGSGEGRLFSTENQGRIWNVIAEPTQLDGSVMDALAFGAPDPNGPGLPGALNNNMLVGTRRGQIFATFVGGGSGNSNAWINISNGLSGGAVQRIVTNPNRGSHEAYAITQDRIFHNVNTLAANTTWVDITGDIFAQTHLSFGKASLTDSLIAHFTLQGLAADWRYVIPDDPTVPNGPTHPMLYVAGDGGVVRSTDLGKTWRVFPDLTLATPVAQGNFPVARVTDLDMVLGNVDPTNGRPNVSTGPNLLLATTYGRGTFGIRLAPIIFNDGTNNVSSSVDSGGNLIFSGLSEQTAFGNQVTITIVDVTDPANPIALGSGPTDGFGRFSVQGNYPQAPSSSPYLYNGVRAVQIFATNASGTKGNLVNFQVTNNPATPAAPVLSSQHLVSGATNLSALANPTFSVTIPNNDTIPVSVSLIRTNAQGIQTIVATKTITGTGTIQDPGPVAQGTYSYSIRYSVNVGTLVVTSLASSPTTVQIVAPLTLALNPADDSGVSNSDRRTNVTQPRFFGTAPAIPAGGLFLDLISVSPASAAPLATIALSNSGNYEIRPAAPLADGTYTLVAQARDSQNNVIQSNTITVAIKTSSPSLTPTIGISPADDTAPIGDGRTIVRRPHIVGVSDPGSVVRIFDANGNLQATVTATTNPSNGNPAGFYSAQLPFELTNGTIVLRAFATDVEGNSSQIPGVLNLSIYSVQGDYNRDGKADLAVFRPNTAEWFVKNSGGTPTATGFGFAGHDVPITGDFFGDGTADLAVYRADTATWFINGGAISSQTQFGFAGHDTPVPAVYDSAGRSEIAVFRPETAQWFILHSNGTGSEVVPFGWPGRDKPVPADFDGDGFAQVAVYRPLELATAEQGGGTWYIRNGITGTTRAVAFPGARAGDVPVAADYDGIGKAEQALYRPSTGQFLIFNPNTGQVRTVDVGAANVDIPVPRDYSGDGKADAAVYHPATATWTYIDSTTGVAVATQFGAPNLDVAVPGPLQYRVNLTTTRAIAPVPAAAVASGSAAAAPVVVGVTTPAAPTASAATATKALARPYDANTVRQPVKLSQVKLRPATATKDPLDEALSELGRSYKGLYFG